MHRAPASNRILVSSAPIARLGDSPYYDLMGTMEVMKRVKHESIVDGFELQIEPEWDGEGPPLTDAEYVDWTKTPKYTFDEILALIEKEGLPVLSVHSSRDIGVYLCSEREKDREKGERLIHDSLSLAQGLGAEVCVFHLWDTWKTEFDVSYLRRVLLDAASSFRDVKASVENVPTHLDGHTPFSLVRSFDYVTLDLRWASMYNEFPAFESVLDRVVNVHLRGRLDGDRWVLDGSDLGFYDSLRKIKREWKYSGLLTLEPEGKLDSSCFEGFVKAMTSLRG